MTLDTPTLTLTAIILTLNEEKHLPNCLKSLAWADEIIVFDSFSTDGTLAMAQAAGATVFQRKFDNYAAQRNAALESTAAEWVFFVDADERATPELAAEIQSKLTEPQAGWWVPRHNYIFGTLTKHAGWFPDYQLRLLRRARARYATDRVVHELVNLDGAEGYLQNPLIHLNYETVAEFIRKQTYYARYDAERLQREGTVFRTRQLLTMPLRQFWWRFITLRGWKEGWHGLRLSLLMSHFEFEKYRLLQSLQTSPKD